MNGLEKEMKFRKELAEAMKENSPAKFAEFLAWRMFNMEKEIDRRFDPIEKNQDCLLDRIWRQLPNKLKYVILTGGLCWMVMSVIAMYAGFIHL